MSRLTSALAAALLVAAVGCSRGAAEPPAADAHADHGHGPGEHAAAPAAAPALCEHGVPADVCTRCTPELAAVFQEQGDWCEEHGLPESHCRQCNPGLTFAAAGAPADWCAEHGVPESACTRCNPKLVAKFIAAGDYCREHGLPESLCPRCHPDRVRAAGAQLPVFPPPELRVRLASEQEARGAGIETRPAEAREVGDRLEVVGRLAFDENRHARLAARADARVVDVRVDVGDAVRAGQELVVLASGAVGSEQARLAGAAGRLEAARAALARETRLAERGVSPRKDVEAARRELAEAQAEHDAARAALAASGGGGGRGGRHALTAPFAGTVVAREAGPGRSVAAGDVLVEIADLRRMWALLEIPETEASQVRAGQSVTIEVEGRRGEPLEGRITRVGAAVDPATRTVTARVELENGARALKAGAFVRATVRLGGERAAVLVPREAVQRAEGRPLVFVRTGGSVYRPLPVEVGEVVGREVEVRGVEAGAEVVTTGAFLLKTEIMKESIGAGCCEEVERAE